MLAADAIIRAHFPRDLPDGLVGGIPLYPTNYYSGAMHRCLQLAANLLDANVVAERIVTPTNGVGQVVAPSVFRPVFRRVQVNGVSISAEMLPRVFDLSSDPASESHVVSV